MRNIGTIIALAILIALISFGSGYFVASDLKTSRVVTDTLIVPERLIEFVNKIDTVTTFEYISYIDTVFIEQNSLYNSIDKSIENVNKELLYLNNKINWIIEDELISVNNDTINVSFDYLNKQFLYANTRLQAREIITQYEVVELPNMNKILDINKTQNSQIINDVVMVLSYVGVAGSFFVLGNVTSRR